MKRIAAAVIVVCTLPSAGAAQEWSQPVRGSWVQADGRTQPGDVTLAGNGSGCELVVARDEHSAVKQAATFLASDIEKISGYTPPIVAEPSGRRVAVRLVTRTDGRWEAYQIRTERNTVWLIGSDFRGTAFAAYTLSERLGIDPLYIWTGYAPEKHSPLVLEGTEFAAGAPTFKYRGFFHDDEDILPRPFDENGYPLQTGTVPRVWYERFFETALRLRLNMVAPYVRVQRPYDIQKTASDWGLIYTSHHYDALVSNPWGFERFGLARARNAGTEWDWFKNRDGLLNFWRGGVLENRDLDVYWPVGLRGTQDRSYTFPDGMSEDDKNTAYREALDAQVAMTKRLLPPGKTPLFHFTLYTEMLPQYQTGKLDVPPDVTIVWTDDNDGRMRALPTAKDQWNHGVYYHLAYFSTSTRLTKQITHLVTPARVEEEFRKIVRAGATEYMLVNVSELREYVMEARMLAEICWDASTAFARPDAAARYVDWWSREYFGAAAAEDAARAYRGYYQQLASWDQIAVGANAVAQALAALDAKADGKPVTPFAPDLASSLEQRRRAREAVLETIATASAKMTADRQQYFYEHVTFPLVLDGRQTKAAIALIKAVAEPDATAARKWCFSAFDELQALEADIRRAERPPFENWYRKTWIRSDDSPYNVHRSYERTRSFLIARCLKP
jgi:glycosyl hydrolase family 115 (putative glucuronidase)